LEKHHYVRMTGGTWDQMRFSNWIAISNELCSCTEQYLLKKRR